MSHTLTIRIQDELARWLEESARGMGISQGQLVRQELERARQSDAKGQRFMRLAGSVRLARNLSTREGFAKS
jgi:predicted transcriptional regulator